MPDALAEADSGETESAGFEARAVPMLAKCCCMHKPIDAYACGVEADADAEQIKATTACCSTGCIRTVACATTMQSCRA